VRHRVLALALLVPFALLGSLAQPPALYAQSGSLDDGIRDLTKQIVPQVQKLGKKRVAVVDFAELDGQVTDLGRYLAEELSASLVLADGTLRIVDRQHLARIIAEQKLSVTGVTEPGTVQRLGELAGADVLVTGSIVGLGDRVKITAKLLSASTAQIVGAAETTVPDDGDVRTLAPNLQHGTVAAAPSPLTPAPVLTPPGRRPGPATLADLTSIAGEPDLYDFTYMSKPITVAGQVLHGGLVVFPSDGHANVTYDLGGRYDRFTAVIGVPDATPANVRMVFRVFVDGQVAVPGRALGAGDPPVPVTVNVTGAKTLLLDVEADGVPSSGQTVVSALWGEPRLLTGR
jgi:TolB-like protein